MLCNRPLPTTWKIYNNGSFIKKKGKADYLIPGSYRPITLENTLNKILERVIADYIADMAEEYTLLL